VEKSNCALFWYQHEMNFEYNGNRLFTVICFVLLMHMRRVDMICMNTGIK